MFDFRFFCAFTATYPSANQWQSCDRHVRNELPASAIGLSGQLSAIFDEQPKPINVQEQTNVRLPADMYDSFENVAANDMTTHYDDRRNRIFAYRPKNTYYAGQTKAADNKSYALPMKPEIVVESTVVIYYQSPSTRTVVNEKGN